MLDDLHHTLSEIFDRCKEGGMELPWIMCVVSPNGSIVATRVSGDGTPGEVLAKHYDHLPGG
jgi:hypothetical protein